jgi:hypothetical protein
VKQDLLSFASVIAQASASDPFGRDSSAPAPNPSVKGTSCGKPQAAPYLER